MIIHLDRIHDEPFHWSETVSVPAEALGEMELSALSDVACEGRVERAAAGYRLQAHLDYEQTIACTRCLEPLRPPVAADLDLLIEVRPPEQLLGEIQLDERDLGRLAIDDERLDTDPILMEQIELNLPMRALCADDCAGLCPLCGGNRNVNPGCCDGKAVDPRWQALEGLRDA